jgi:hypothetical protein
LWSVLKVDSNSRCTSNLTVIAVWSNPIMWTHFCWSRRPGQGESPGSANHDSLGTSDLPVAIEPLAIRWQMASLPV